MSEPTTFEIVLRGRASARLLRPLLDDFTITHTPGTHTPDDHSGTGHTRLVGEVRDAAHLHGVVAHLTAVNVELVSIVPVTQTVGGHSPAARNTETVGGHSPAARNTETPEVQPEWSKS